MPLLPCQGSGMVLRGGACPLWHLTAGLASPPFVLHESPPAVLPCIASERLRFCLVACFKVLIQALASTLPCLPACL